MSYRQLGNFQKKGWKMHTQKAQQKLVKKIENGEEEKSMYSIISTPILDFPVKQVVSCNMHCLMAILCKLVCRTSADGGVPHACL